MKSKTKKNLFKWITTSVGLIPGLSILVTNIQVLPGFSSKILGGLIEAVCGFLLLIIWTNRNRYRNIKISKINKQSFILLIIFFFFFLSYMILYSNCSFEQGTWSDNTLRPLWISEKAKTFISQQNGDVDRDIDKLQYYFSKRGPIVTSRMLNNKSYISIFITTIIIYIVFIFMFASLTVAMSLLWIKNEIHS